MISALLFATCLLGWVYTRIGDVRLCHTRIEIFGVSINRAMLEHRYKKKGKDVVRV
jgi:hypothetical protein